MLTFKPQQATSKLLKVVNGRTRDVLERRYGLGSAKETSTLESIGKSYGITRERVRQIENHGIHTIRKSPVYSELEEAFKELHDFIHRLGIIVAEDILLDEIVKQPQNRNHVFFLLTVGNSFTRIKENGSFTNRWHIDTDIASYIEDSLHAIANSLSEDELVSGSEITGRLAKTVQSVDEKHVTEENLLRWLSISKRIGRNPLGEWGDATSTNVRTKGVRDYAYLIVKRHGSPMHFREVADAIQATFSRKAHVATTHNELIKDKRFVLVGRGLYALVEWGYMRGVVKDVIQNILRNHGELTKEEIIDLVRKERYVKDNTVLVNLQDPSLFKKMANGKYVALD